MNEILDKIGAGTGPMIVSSPTTATPIPEATYTIDVEAGVLRLDGDPAQYPNLARVRPAAPFLRDAEVEMANRRNAVTARKLLAESLQSQLKRAEKLEEKARRAYEDSKGYEWSSPSADGFMHTFQVSIAPRTIDDPFPGPMDNIRSAVVVGCSSDHCRLEGSVVEVPQDRLNMILNTFQKLKGEAISAQGATKYVKDQIRDVEQQLHDAEIALKTPVRFAAHTVLAVPDHGASVVNVDTPSGRMMPGRK